MTKRQAIQIQIKGLQEIFDNMDPLRDAAFTDQERIMINNVKRELPQIWAYLQAIDNSFDPQVAQYEVKGDYSIIIGVEHI